MALICLFRLFDVRLFGGLLLDIRRRYRHYGSDIIDGLNLQCLATIIFLYFACITPIVTFGGMLGQTTEGYMVSVDQSGLVCNHGCGLEICHYLACTE